MRPAAIAFAAAGFLASAAAAALVANFAVNKLEQATERLTKTALVASGQSWADVRADGTLVILTGTAPDEKKRIQALDSVTAVVSSNRIRNQTEVAESVPAVAPDFALEILRNGTDISLIGITPEMGEDSPIHDALGSIDHMSLIDMQEPTDWPAPEGWASAFDFGVKAMTEVERAKISILPGAVSVTAVVKSDAEKTLLAQKLLAEKPDDVTLNMEITAPRPIFSPYSLTFVKNGTDATLLCEALTKESAATIIDVAKSSGVSDPACEIGLGAPTDNWAEVAIAGINAVNEMGRGQLEMQDSGITLISPEGFDPDRFAAITDRLQAALPEAYVLHPVLTKKPLPEDADSRPQFTAKRPAEGPVVLSGVTIDEISRQTVESYAEAMFGFRMVNDKTEIANFAPHGWTPHQLVALDVLGLLDEGEISISEEEVIVTGKGQVPNLQGAIKMRLDEGFGADARFSINVEQVIPAPETPDVPDPKQCEADIAALLAKNRILFPPSSAVIEAESEQVITEIAKVLNRCNTAWFEVGGHTDSQGGEDMNRNLSQARADAVIDALLSRNLLLGPLTAVGYGETRPIADNETEAGRMQNRRIEFKLREGDPATAAREAAALKAAATAVAEAMVTPDPPLRRPENLKTFTVDFLSETPQNSTSEETNGQN